MSDLHVIITVPHASCEDSIKAEKSCDTLAYNIALSLKKHFESKEVKVSLYANTSTPRKIMDMNRVIARSTEYRKTIQDKLEQLSSKGKNVYVFDIHSFPDIKEYENNFQVYLLPHDKANLVRSAVSLSQYMNTYTSLSTGVYLSDESNDITLQALEIIPTSKIFLLENWEALSPKQIYAMTSCIVAWTLQDSTSA